MKGKSQDCGSDRFGSPQKELYGYEHQDQADESQCWLPDFLHCIGNEWINDGIVLGAWVRF